MQRQDHRARQPTDAIGRPAAAQQTRRLSQSAAPQQTRRGCRTASAQLHSQCRRSPATFRWTGFSRAAAIDKHAAFDSECRAAGGF